MSLKNSKMTKSTKEKHGVKKTLRTAVILCAAVAGYRTKRVYGLIPFNKRSVIIM